MFTLYPFFHPERPRFFNTATLYKETVFAILIGIKKMHYQEMKQDFCCLPEPEDFVERNYELTKSQHDELELPVLGLTNPQKLWLALAHTSMLKYNADIPESYHSTRRLAMDQLNERFHKLSGFEIAFTCWLRH